MRRIVRALLSVAAVLACGAVMGGAFIASGIYNIGADDHHHPLVLALSGELRTVRSRVARAASTDLEDPARMAAGAHRYAALCVNCHLAPGVTRSELRPGLYPHPPNLAQQAPPDPQRALWSSRTPELTTARLEAPSR